ncbi:MAG: benzoyl-CoA-dihydrodiol lyase [Deltaproteobacteria bacterium]|nr:benzoyl-CoA-dihydrodiol lyase [Deltaproteobacteria bacterium]
MEPANADTSLPHSFETHPSRYKHLKLEVKGAVAWLKLDVQENEGLKPGYQLKLNSYDLGVDLELNDAVQRLRFEHPEVACVVVTSAQSGVFSAGANIFMLGTSTHAFKVNFCKYTNETRLAIEDASANSGQRYIAALNGIASGGGYELPLACEEIYLIDDRKSAVALPEVPYLGVLPGTGGLTRVVDKRKVRKDLADIFVTLAEGVKGKRAQDWGLVDGVYPSSKFNQEIEARAQAIAGKGRPDRKGVALESIAPYRHLTLELGAGHERVAKLTIKGPTQTAYEASANWYPLRVFRELDDALLRLRFHHPNIGLVVVKSEGDPEKLRAIDAELYERRDQWFVKETLLLMKRVLKRMDTSAKSFFTLAEKGSCFVGSLAEIALSADRIYLHEEAGVGMTALNNGLLPMGNGLSRLHTRFLNAPDKAVAIAKEAKTYRGEDAFAAGLATVVLDALDWDDDVRLAIEERASMSPDSLTGLEASLRFAGPETLETKIFGRLSAWQNWIFQRPNAVGEHGALTLYGRPESPSFDWRRC